MLANLSKSEKKENTISENPEEPATQKEENNNSINVAPSENTVKPERRKGLLEGLKKSDAKE